MNATVQTLHRAAPGRADGRRPAPPEPIQMAPTRLAPIWPPLLPGRGPLAELITGVIAVGTVITGPWLG